MSFHLEVARRCHPLRYIAVMVAIAFALAGVGAGQWSLGNARRVGTALEGLPR